MKFDETESFEIVAVKVETPHAILVVSTTEDWSEHWIPKSVIDDDSEVKNMKHATGTLIVARWFAEKEGMA